MSLYDILPLKVKFRIFLLGPVLTSSLMCSFALAQIAPTMLRQRSGEGVGLHTRIAHQPLKLHLV